MNRVSPPIDTFEIGWICALPIELAAARAMLDEEYPSTSGATEYILGRVGAHNVVVLYLPAGQIGTNAAANVGAVARSNFPGLRAGLMVRVGAASQALGQMCDWVMSRLAIPS
jgi:hypothetical protein